MWMLNLVESTMASLLLDLWPHCSCPPPFSLRSLTSSVDFSTCVGFLTTGGLRIGTVLICVWLPEEIMETAGPLEGYIQNWHSVHLAALGATEPAQIWGCGATEVSVRKWQNHTTGEHWDGRLVAAIFGKCITSHLVSQAQRAAGSLSVHIPGCVFKSVKLLGTVFPPCLCHGPHPPRSSYIKMYWVSTKGLSLWCSQHHWIQGAISAAWRCTKQFSLNVALLFLFRKIKISGSRWRRTNDTGVILLC